MKRVIIFLLFILVCSGIKAQAFKTSGTGYEYDANGNRTKSTVIYLTTTLKAGQMGLNEVVPADSFPMIDTTNLAKTGWEPPLEEPMNGFTFKIYPNPVHANLIIELTGNAINSKNGSANTVQVFDMQGKEVMKVTNISTYMPLNFSRLPNATYLISIKISGQVKNYKIIKE